MAQTDRQTDKATWWSITEYDPECQQILSDNTRWPDWVKKVYGGLEECPETKNIHFQGAVQCVRQVRFNAMKEWLPKAHIEAAKCKEALQKYAMKKETAIGDKKVVSNSVEYWSMERSFVELAKHWEAFMEDFHHDKKKSDTMTTATRRMCQQGYWYCVQRVCSAQPFRLSIFAQPQMEKTFVNTYPMWLSDQFRSLVLQTGTQDPPLGPGPLKVTLTLEE